MRRISEESALRSAKRRLLSRLVANGECVEYPINKGCDYGRVMWNGVRWKAHRLSWYFTHGRLPRDMEVCHRCDNPACVRIDHLFLGTHKENMHDSIAKGRAHVGNPLKVLRGEAVARATTTEAQVRAIRSISQEVSSAAVGRLIGVSADVASRIRKGSSWSHVQ